MFLERGKNVNNVTITHDVEEKQGRERGRGVYLLIHPISLADVPDQPASVAE